MNKECKIKDDDEILEEEKQRYNFRRFTPEELNKKNSPFERFKKKEYPFLFQKKKVVSKDSTTSISLNEIIEKVKDLSLNTPPFTSLNAAIPSSPHTPPYPPWDNIDFSGNIIITHFDLNDTNLNTIEKMDLDEQK